MIYRERIVIIEAVMVVGDTRKWIIEEEKKEIRNNKAVLFLGNEVLVEEDLKVAILQKVYIEEIHVLREQVVFHVVIHDSIVAGPDLQVVQKDIKQDWMGIF
jgi:hypothetical protein